MRQHLRRSHRDPVFGPLKGGTPQGNFNAINTGRHIKKLPDIIVPRLAHHLAAEPENYLDHLNWAIKKLHYPKDIVVSIQILIMCLQKLQPRLADTFFTRELDDWIEKWPPESRVRVRSDTWKHLHNVRPVDRLYIFRKEVERIPNPTAILEEASSK